MSQTHLVLVDGMSFLFRAFHAVRGNLSKTDGTPTNALYGFSQMLIKVVDDLAPTHCVVCLDSPGKTFRHGMYPDYKANRPPPPPELVAQMAYLEPLIQAFGLPILRQSGVEADDLIATAIATHGGHVPGDEDTPETNGHRNPQTRITVVTSDKDLMQLVGTTATTEVRLLDTLKGLFVGLPEVHEKFGVKPDQVVDVQALMGDSSDNVPGVPGIGPKTAADLINTFGSFKNLYASLAEVKNERIRNLLTENREKAELSYRLVLLKTDVPLPPDQSLAFHPALHQAADYLREELEFRTLAKRLETRIENPEAGPHHAEPLALKPNTQHLAPNTQHPTPKAHNPTPTTQHPAWGPYDCIQTEAAWQSWLTRVRANGWAAFDTETTSLNPLEATLVGISLATGAGQACYVPLNHGGAEGAPSADLFAEPAQRPAQLPVKRVLDDLLALVAEGIPLVAHNLKYDWEVLAHTLGLTPGETGPALQTLLTRYEDTMLMSACLDGGRWNHNLNELARRHLHHEMIPFEAVAGKGKTQITFDAVPLGQATAYAAEDADATARLFLHFVARLRAESPSATEPGPAFVYAEIEKKLLPVIIALESRGITLDTAMLHGLSADLHTRLSALESQVHELAGEAFNLNSPSQLGAILFDKLNLGTPAQKKKKSTGVEVLESLAEDETNPLARQLGEAMMSYRQLSKLRSTYAETLPKQVNSTTRRVHTTYHQVGAATGRFSSADPNLQNIPIRTEEGRKIRRAFIPAAPYKQPNTQSPTPITQKWSMLSADYSQIELRLLAHFSGSPALRQAFEDGLDVHAYTAALVGNKKLEDVTKPERRAAKIVNFGLVYGMGTRSLAKQIGCTVPEAQGWIDAYFQRYSGVKEYMELNRQHARENGYVETLFGRRIWLPDIISPNGGLRANAERAAINAPLQGSNADIIKLAMPKVEAYLAEHRLQAQTLLQVHDELVLEAPEPELEHLKTALPALMSGVVTLAVPLVVETGTGPNWDAAH